MDIFVINLKAAHERRESISNQLDDLGLRFELFPAVYGKQLTKEELAASYFEAGAMRIQCRKLTQSEIGCALSHIGVYREIVRREIPCALVLEDDVEVGGLSQKILLSVAQKFAPNHPAVILLSPADTKPPSQALGILKIQVSPFRNGYCTHAYIITQYAARALLEALYPVKDVADCWSRLMRHRIVDIFVITPPVVLQNQEQFGSSTTNDIRSALANNGALDKALFKIRRAFWCGVDLVSAGYDRCFNPYAGVLKRAKQAKAEKGNS